MDKKTPCIVWIVSRLTAVGGGEQLLFEGAIYYRSLGYRVVIFTWEFKETSLFDGKYSSEDIVVLNAVNTIPRSKIFRRALDRMRSLIGLRKKIQVLNPEFIIVQSEYDAITAYFVSIFSKIKFKVLIFGQTFQFPHDWAKYTLVFRNSLKEIVRSMAGYEESIPLVPPPIGVFERIAIELVCAIRFLAIRSAEARFVFSKQVQWEVMKLYGVGSIIAKGAYQNKIFEHLTRDNFLQDRFGITSDRVVYLSLSRLVRKKRIDLCIESFVKLNNPDAVLLIGGRGEDEERLKSIAALAGDRCDIRFIGYVHATDVWSLKQSVNVFVSLDIADYDITSVEALALGTKVVWTDEIDIDKEDGKLSNLFVCTPKNEDVVAAMRAAAIEIVKPVDPYLRKYTWANYFDLIRR